MKRILATLICLLLLFPSAAALADPFPFAGGEGTAADPYLIENETHLQSVRLYPDAYFLLTCDIVSTSDWVPIGTQSKPFTGCFDGGGHTVSGLHASVHTPAEAYMGMFGWNSGTIRNLRITDCNFIASALTAYAGGIAAVNHGILEGCSVTGRIEATTAAGCLAGKTEASGSVSRCHSGGWVSAETAGGISGISTGWITNCLNTGSVHGNTAGGILGHGYLSAYCCNAGDISGAVCGGIAGEVPLSYAGSNDGSTCFFTERTPEGIGNRAGCIKLTDAQMSLATSFTGFDFESIWYMGSAHPQLRMKQPIQPVVPTGIVIVSLPDKTEYLEKEVFCPDGLSVVLCYSDGTSVPVTDYLLGGYEGTVGKHTVTVTHSGFCVTFPVTVKAVSPDAITSSVYTVTPQWLRKIPLHTTVSALIKGLDSSDFIAVFNGESQPGENAYVRTGMTVAIMDGNNRKFSVTAVVTGDVNGDGKLTSADLQEVIHHLLKKQLLSEAYAQATDCNGDGNVTLTDFLLLKSHILVDSTPTPN